MTRRVRVIGGGRAGGSFARALGSVGWDVVEVLGRDDDPARAADGVDLVLLATPDGVVADVAAAVDPLPGTVVAHVAGSLGLDVVARHPRHGAIHPLVSLPGPDVGAERLRAGGWFAVAGDPLTAVVVADLGGRALRVADEDRALYHAAACVASNHLVALFGQVERLAAGIGVPVDAYLDLARGSLDNVAALGAAAALTGPAARGDDETIRRHLEAMAPGERPTYESMVIEARRLAAGRRGGKQQR